MRRQDLLYPELSFVINGVLFEVFKELGGGHHERYYQKAVAIGLKNKNLTFREQVFAPLKFAGETVGRYYLDFLVEEKIVLELKRGKYMPVNIINQTKQYQLALNLKLAIIGCFGHDCVVIKRIVNQEP